MDVIASISHAIIDFYISTLILFLSSRYREQQCSKFDNNNFNIQNLARDVKWHAKYTRSKRRFLQDFLIYPFNLYDESDLQFPRKFF